MSCIYIMQCRKCKADLNFEVKMDKDFDLTVEAKEEGKEEERLENRGN